MAFKYINPGIADLFDEVSINCKQYTNNTKSRTSGDCFSISDDINALYLERSKEYWIAMAEYYGFIHDPDNDFLFIIDAPSTNDAINRNNYICISKYKIDRNRFALQFKYKNNIIYKGSKALLYWNMYHFEFYIKDDPVDGEIKVWVDGVLFINYKGNTGNGNGYNRLEIRTTDNDYNKDYISDLVVQNTGRIGDIRVNSIPTILDTCEWDVKLPYGYSLNSTNFIGNVKGGSSYILFGILFGLDGKVNNIKLKTNGINSIQFCLFRKNSNEKYDAVETTKAYTNLNGICDIELETPMNVQVNDCLGFYLDGGVCAHFEKDTEIYYYIEGNVTANKNISIPTTKYKWQPDICAYLTPDNKDEGVQFINKNDYGNLVTNIINKKVMNKLSITDLKIGRIDSIAITNRAKYEGESPANGIAAVIEDKTSQYESDTKVISTSYKNLSLITLDKNPINGNMWNKSELQNISLGIKSKASENGSKGIYLDGASTYITLPKELLAGKSIYTIELSFSTTQKVTSSEDWSAPCICGMLNYGGNIIAITNNDGYVSLIVSGGNVGRELMADGQVHNIAIISDGTIMKGYHNSKQYEQTRESKPMDNIPINFGIGLPQCQAYAKMTLYEARFWEIAKKPGELGNKIAGNELGLRAWYRCLETSGDVLKDSSNNKFDGKMVGNVWGG